ncbi:MAG: 6-carboxytetrahydropterin synthase [Rikenellaceae bacterium]
MKNKIRLTKEFSFEMAHALEGYDGACKHIHGHSYRMFITVIGSPVEDETNPKYGMVMDFGQLKKMVNSLIVDRYDHTLVLRYKKEKKAFLDSIVNEYEKVEIVDYQPTCENMICYFAELISAALPENVSLHHIKLHETATSYAEWYASDNE